MNRQHACITLSIGLSALFLALYPSVGAARYSLAVYQESSAENGQVRWSMCGSSPLPDWLIEPEIPTCREEIWFAGPTEVFATPCHAGWALGTPYLAINHDERTIELRFGMPPQDIVCIQVLVCGLDGSFGPLRAGDWLFFSVGDGFYMPPKFPSADRPRFMLPFEVLPVPDLTDSGRVDAVDVQVVINAAIGMPVEYDADANGDGVVNAVDVQLVINAALEGV